MKHSFPCVALAALVIFAAVLPKTSGQTTSSLVLTDSSGGGSGASIDGMELRGSGLYWWKFGYAGGEIGSYAPSVGIKGLISRYALNLDRSGPFYMVQAGTTYPTGAERDGAYAYFTANRGGAQVGLFRQLLSSAVNSPPERLAGIVTPEISTGAIGRFGSDLFFAPTYAGGYTAIWRVSFDAAGNFTGAGVTAEGFLNGYAVRKIQFLNTTINGVTGTYGVCLQADTSLWRFGPLESSSLQPMAYLGAGVGDIGVRRDDGGNAFNGLHDKIYATTSPISGGPIGKLVTINPANGAVTEIYADPGGQKFLAFGFDANFLFLSRTNSPTGEILRKFVPYLSYLTNPVPGQPTGWVTIETVNGTNLRSDGRLLYFTRGNDIRRVSTAVPGISVDVHAFGIEAVQISQDYNNSWPLVAGKPVLVRGYARMAALANAGGSTRQPAATLGVIRNNIGLGNFHPDNSPLIDAEPAASLAIYRGSIARSYNFVIPAELVQSGSMQFTLNVNNPRGMVETGVANPYGNNSISTPVMQVLASGAPSIVCVPLATTDGTYTLDTSPGDFWAQIARARTLLPVSDIRVLTSAAVLKRWTVQYDPPKSGFTRFGFPGDQDEALTRLGAVQGEVSGHNVGMVHPAVSGFNGLGNTSGAKNLLARMEPGTASPGNGWDSSRGGRTLAHEMAHNYGRQHVNFTSGSEAPLGPDMSYPGNPANISGVAGAGNNNLATSVFGWDPVSGQCVDGAVIPDLLSYGASRWLSRYTFNALLAAVPAAALIAPSANGAAAFAVGDVFLISGMVEIAKALASLDPVQLVPDGTYDSGVVAASLAAAALPPGHDYRVRQLDETGAVLAESPLVLGPTGDGWREKTGFRQFLSAEPGAVKLQIVKNGAVLAQVDGAGAAPVVAVDAPVLDAGGQVLRGSWMATDADGDPLFSTVHFSADGGVTWKAVEQQSIQSSVAVDVRTLPGGANCQLRVIVTDGFNTSIAASEGFSLDTHAPEITLIGVQPGQKIAYGSRASLTAFAMDAEEGSLPGGGISWVLSGPQPAVKNGDTLYLENLPPGNYLAVASVTDAGGAPASKELAFEVLPIPLTVGTAPGLNGEIDDAAYASAPVAQWPFGTNGRISARLLRSGGRLYVGFSELPYRVGVNPLARVGIRIDVDGSADAEVQSSDFGFFLDEDGRPLQTEGNGATMVTRGTPAAGFETALSSGEASWTAEFALPESVLGGAGHGMRIMFSVELGQVGGASLLYRWPAAADIHSPASWAPVQLGELPASTNVPPIAHAGGNQVVEPAEDFPIFLEGGGSTDPEGQPLSYRWQQIDGDPVTLVDETTARPSWVVSPVGSTTVRRFELIVNDGELDSAPAEVAVTAVAVVPPSPPREVPRFTRYPDGTVEGYFAPGDFPNEDGSMRQAGLGSQGLYSIETSEDLLEWTPQFDTSPDLLGRLVFNDLAAGDFSKRFYRAVMLGAAGVLSPGSALEYDGAVRWVNVPHSTAFNTYPLTVSAWINTSDTTPLIRGVVSKYADTSVNGWSMFVTAGRIHGFYFAGGSREVWGGGFGLDGGFIADGVWHHVAMVIGTTGGKMYVDGAAVGNLPWTGTPAATTTTQPVQIGRYHTYPNGFVGQIDEVSIWAAELTNLQIIDLRRRAPVGTESNLRGLWKLDDDAGTLATDSTPNLRHGTLNGGPQWVPSTAPIRR